MTSRRMMFVGAALVIGLSACGSSNSTSGAPAASSVSTPATVASGGRPVIHLGSVGGAMAPSTASVAGDAMPSADTKMAVMRDITYVFDGDLPTVAESGPSWKFPTGFVADQARIAAIAKALGATGDVRPVSAEQGGGWMVGPDDYSAATLTVSPDVQGSWWFSPAPATPAEATDASTSCAYDGGDLTAVAATGQAETGSAETGSAESPAVTPAVAVPDCPQPTPPIGVPGQDASITATKTLLTTLGYDAAAYDYDFSGDEWGANVTATLLLGGQRSPVTMSFGFGADSQVTWAYGSLAMPVPADTFPLASVQTGLDRLNDQADQWMSYGVSDGAIRTDTATDGVSSTSRAVPAIGESTATVGESNAAAVAPEPPASDPAVSDPGPPRMMPPDQCDPAACPVPTPLTIHLTTVKLDMTMVFDDDGTGWILPAYTFGDGNPDDGTYTVLAVSDDSVALPAPVAVPLPKPAPDETVVVGTAVVGTAVVDPTVVVATVVNPTGGSTG